jgi:hypothetical protein
VVSVFKKGPAMTLSAWIAPLALALSLTALGAAAQTRPAPPPLVAHAAADFRQHAQPLPSQFRRVHQGLFTAPDGRTRTVLCGEFKAGERSPWTKFATVQTDPYEQWLGDGAQGFCKPPGFKPAGPDWSADLLQRVKATATNAAPLSSAPAR